MKMEQSAPKRRHIKFRCRGITQKKISRMDTQLFSNLVIIHLLAYEDGTECSETSAYKIHMPGNYPEENLPYGYPNYSQI